MLEPNSPTKFKMNSKILKIGSGHNTPPNKFEIVEVEKNVFMLKTKISHFGLAAILEKWLNSNTSMEELSYCDMLWKKSRSTSQVLIEDDNFFISGEGKFIQWSVPEGKATKDYSGIMVSGIHSMLQTSDKEYVYLSDDKGF